MRPGMRSLTRAAISILVLLALLGVPAPRAATALAHDLAADERLGGHTLARHVGRSDDDLRARLAHEPRIRSASTYTNRQVAEEVVAVTLARSSKRVAAWAARRSPRPNLALDYTGHPSRPLGRSLARRDGTVRPACDAVVVLKDDGHGGWFVLTSYPEERRR